MTSSSSQRRALVVRNNLSPFGDKLVKAGYVDSGQMQQALVQSRQTGKPLPLIIRDLTGTELPPDLLRQYKRQQLFELKVIFGVESLDPELEEQPTDNISDLIDQYIPIDICRQHRLVPLVKQDTNPPSLLVAMVDPDNLKAQDDLNRILRPKQLIAQRLVIAPEDYERLISDYLDKQVARQQEAETAKAIAAAAEEDAALDVNVETMLADLGADLGDAPAEDFDGADLSDAMKEAAGAPVVNLANQILVKALSEGVSDIHIEPQEEFLRVRFRKDGVLQQAFPNIPKKIIPALISRFKIMSELDIAERRLPQDGRIRRVFKKKKVDFRVNTLPSRFGEKICMRLLSSDSTQLGLDKLISDADTLQTVRDMASRPFGLILVTGPTGSGKSTSLYSMLAERNDPGVNISTAEDPIEYGLPGINQVQVIREKGMNFASILRAFMRQDPDIILVGETRDLETAKTAIEAALTGHSVRSLV